MKSLPSYKVGRLPGSVQYFSLDLAQRAGRTQEVLSVRGGALGRSYLTRAAFGVLLWLFISLGD